MTKLIVKLAAFVMVCAVFTAYLAFTIGNIHPFRHTYHLTATFDDATGLLKEDNVKVAGVVVGKVVSVSLDQGRAKVGLAVKTSVRLPSDSRASIRWRNLIGQRYVYLYPGEASTMLRSGDRVTRTTSVVDIGELFNRLGPIVKAIDPKQVNVFLDAIVGALDGNQDKLRQSLDDLAKLASSLGQRDEAIGRLVENLNTVSGAITDRDAQIRTVLDNLLELAKTFSANTNVLDSAVTDLGDFSDRFGSLLANNRVQLDHIVDNLAVLVGEVRTKLPVIDHAVGGLDEAAKRLFTSSRYGEWLNQVIPCGAIGNNPTLVMVNDNCVTGSSSLIGSTSTGASVANTSGASAPARPGASGADAISQLLGGTG